MVDSHARPDERRVLPTRVIVATALAAALAPLNSTMLSVALRDIGASLGETESTLTRALVTPYLVASVVMQAPGGKLGDLLGHRRALMLGQLVFAAGALVAVLAPGLAELAIARVAMASAGALIVPSAMALLRNELPPEVRGRAFGAFGATMSLAAAIGPLVGGQLTSALGWRSVFAVNLIVLPLSALLARGSHGAAGAKRASSGGFDWLGSVLLGASLAAWVLGVGRGRAPNVGLLVAGLVLLVVFVLHERRHPSPVVELSLLKNAPFVAGGVMIALHNLAMYALLFELPAVCGIVLGASARQTGPLLVSIMGPMVIGSLVAGRLTDSLGARSVAAMGALVTAGGFGLLLATPMTAMMSLVPGLLVVGAGLGLSTSPTQSASMSAVPPESSGVAAGLMATLRYLGGIVGTLVLSIVLSDATDASAALAAHRTALMIFLGAACVAIPCAWALPVKARAARA
jgi:EmrB/QacA subfamily drug resistance transporter